MSNSEELDEERTADSIAARLRRLDERLERLEELIAGVPAAGAERERTVAGALDSLTSQLNQFTATLVEEVRRNTVTAVDAGVAELRAGAAAQAAPLEAIRAALAELATRADPAAVTAPVLDRTAVVLDAVSSIHADLEALALGVRGVRDDIAGSAAADAAEQTRLSTIATAVDALAARPFVTAADLDAAVSALTDGPAPLTAGDLAPLLSDVRALAARPEPPTAEEMRAAMTLELASHGEPATVADVEAAIGRLTESVAASLGEQLRARLDAATADAAGSGELTAVREALDELRARPALPTADDVAAAVSRLEGVVAGSPDDVAERVSAALAAMRAALAEDLRAVAATLARLAARPEPATVEDLAPLLVARSDETEADGFDVTAVVERMRGLLERDLRAVAAGLARLAGRPEPATPGDLAPIREALAELAGRPEATPADLAPLYDAIAGLAGRPAPTPVDLSPITEALAELAGRPAPVTAAELTPLVRAVDAVAQRPVEPAIDLRPVEARIEEVAAAVGALHGDLAALAVRPTGTTPDDLGLTADRLDAAVRDVRDEVRAMRTSPDPDPAVLEVAAQLDAVGRVLQDLLAALHRIEDGTVGSNPRRERSRQSALAAVGDLRSGRRRLATADPDAADPEAPTAST